ncbi:HDOD domain-containing protein [Agarivorans sp. MS3-6]|uniref:HDOD domain-containing protein n=1 Tax=Agarivorans sp. TSD2052 TaxID=2937286 RepID=UPI00200DCED4|nr:HDOD domain-containing protein [Agarivorans sp. TSD2052]UPW18964.1 HDOD domain-containing protein [Agarivorans sp. TSD2052]
MELEAFFQQVKKLPVMPQIMQELLTSINDDSVDLHHLGRKLATDQSLGANVLKMANSAAFRGVKQIDSIEAAAIRLGLKRVRSIVVAAGLNGMMPTKGFDQQQFWSQAMYVALLSQALAKCTEVDPDTAFTCGMLHNFGELLIASATPEEAGLIELCLESGETRVSAQRQTLGLDYAQIGGELAHRWNFSPLVTDAIEQQLNPMDYDEVSQPAVLIRLAIFAHHALDAGLSAEMVCSNLPAPLCELVGLNKDNATLFVEEALEQAEDMVSASVV